MPEVTNPSARAYSRKEGSRCGGCGAEATSLRRGRCAGCYARWVRARPVGIGAICGACSDRRLSHLRHFELHSLWVVLCHNCAARAEKLPSLPRSLDALITGLLRERRDLPRPDASTPGFLYASADRRPPSPADRRVSERNLRDGSELVVVLEADYAEKPDPHAARDEFATITDVHLKL